MFRQILTKLGLLLGLVVISLPSNASASIVSWSFTAVVNGFSSSAPISLPFTVSPGDQVVGLISLDYSDPGAPYITPFIYRYSNQPNENITASINGVPILTALTPSFRHDAEVWNDSEFHDGADLFFMSRQTVSDTRYSGYEVSMSISGNDSTGQTISSLALPLSLDATDFGGLTFGLGIIDPTDLSPSFQLSAHITSITPVPVPAASFLFLSGLSTFYLLTRRSRRTLCRQAGLGP